MIGMLQKSGAMILKYHAARPQYWQPVMWLFAQDCRNLELRDAFFPINIQIILTVPL
jgi:hypothetical protein